MGGMPLPAEAFGTTTAPIAHDVDSRWLMAYAASIGALDERYLDTRRPAGIMGHPLFPVCVEWPAVLAVRDVLTGYGVTPEEAARGVHLRHDLRIGRLIHPGDHLTTVATLAGITTHRAGGLVELDLVTTDEGGAPVASTRMTTLYRGVGIDGDDHPAVDLPSGMDGLGAPAEPPEPGPAVGASTVPHHLDGGAAHVYTECSRIWNPIHTDARTAARAGLPGIILHGTATLALAVNHVMDRLGADPDHVRRVAVRFGAAVPLPSTVELRVLGCSPGGDVAWFDAIGDDGRPVLRRGVLVTGPVEVHDHG